MLRSAFITVSVSFCCAGVESAMRGIGMCIPSVCSSRADHMAVSSVRRSLRRICRGVTGVVCFIAFRFLHAERVPFFSFIIP